MWSIWNFKSGSRYVVRAFHVDRHSNYVYMTDVFGTVSNSVLFCA